MAEDIVKTVLDVHKIEHVVDIHELNSFFIYNFNKNYCGFNETHKDHEFIYVIEGQECVYEDDKTYILSKGQALLHKPFAIHKDNPIGGNSKICEFSFVGMVKNVEILYDRVLDLTDEQIYLLNDIFNYATKHYFINNNQTFYSGRENEKNNEIVYGSDQILKNKVELFLIGLLSSTLEKENIKKNNKEESYLITKIITSLDSKKCQKFSLDEIATELNYSKNYLCRYFKDNTNTTINEYFYKLKIEEAKRLLIVTDDSMKEISDRLSFNSVQHFSSAFKKNTGVTPSSWRKNTRKYKYY